MSTGLLDFFVLEGSECVEQMDGLLARAASGAPDLDQFARNARALRGSATMAKVPGITDVANAVERIAKGLKDGSLQWSPALRGSIVAAIDDLKILIRGVRAWGPAEDTRAQTRSSELNEIAPPPARSAAPTPIAAAGSGAFLAVQTADVAAGLRRFAENPGPIATFAETLARIRALRGVAALLDLPPLAEVVAAVDDAAKGLEIGSSSATDALLGLFRAASVVLAEGSAAIHAGGRPDAGTDAVFKFTIAAQSFVEGAGDEDQVVPIASLFPDGDGNNIIMANSNPPTTAAARFTLEVVSQAEHLRRLVGDARRASDAPTRQRLGHELRGAIRSLVRSAESFGERVIAASLAALAEGAASLDLTVLGALDESAALLATRADGPVAPKIEAIARKATPMRSSTPIRSSTPMRAGTPVAAMPAVPAAVEEPLAAAPSGTALHDMLGAGISGLALLDSEPLAEPAELEDDGVVPIQDLLYRGKSALRRAAQLGQTFRTSGGTPNAEALAELYDLLELAEAE